MITSTDFINREYKWSAPSNIALIKYWGKKPGQIPCNPSLSITLKNSITTTSVKLIEKEDTWIKFYLDNIETPSFTHKIITFIERLGAEWSFLRDYSLSIHSANTFPHSSGMASSASAMAALSLCFLEMKKNFEDEDFREQASCMARLGSGSACRSLFPGMSLWGIDDENGANEFGIPFTRYHSFFDQMRDTVLIVSSEEKAVSSTKGHALLDNNPYAQARYEQARNNLARLKGIIQTNDFTGFAEVVESEALSLHAMMMTSSPGYILMKPETLKIIEKIQKARREGLNICFTLDAGPNVHVLYPSDDEVSVLNFIKTELISFCEDGRYIEDEMGLGPERLTSL